MSEKIKVLFYLKNLSGGGAERFHTELFKNYNNEKFEYKLFLKDSRLVDYQSSLQEENFLKEAKWYKSLRLSSFPATFLQLLCLRLPGIFSSRILTFYKKFFIERRLKKYVIKHKPKEADFNTLCENIMIFFTKNWKSVFVLNRAITHYQPKLIVGSLVETSNALVFLSLLTQPAIYRNTHWIIIEHNNTHQRFEDYYSGEQNQFWNEFTKIIFNSAKRIITVSEGVKTGLIKFYGMVPNKISVIYNQVDFTAIRQVTPVKTNIPFILCAGRLHSQKRFDMLIRSFAKISDQINTHLFILGKGNLEFELRALAQDLGVKDKVHFMGFRPDLWSYMKSAQLFVVSSKYEGFGNVIIEAMACGCPVVSFNCDYGPAEIIEHKKNGLLVENGNEKKLADAILQLLTNSKLRQTLINNGNKRAMDFKSGDIAKKYEKVFSNEICNFAE